MLTLIDFLFQIIFFGIFIYAIYMTQLNESKSNENRNDEQIKRLQNFFGIGDLTELTDKLTRLAPVEEIQHALEAKAYIDEKGGKPRIDDAIRKLDEGVGKPHCIPTLNNKKVAIDLAEVVATDDRIVFQKETQELSKLLGILHLKFSDIRDLSLPEFNSTFRQVLAKEPSCRYTLRFKENTNYVYASNIAEQIFYLRKIHVGK